MKSILLVFVIAFLFSCKKDYVCSCNFKGLKTEHAIFDTKGNAEDKCNEFVSGGADCTLEKKSK